MIHQRFDVEKGKIVTFSEYQYKNLFVYLYICTFEK
jgi:hypothetical protein